MAAEVEAQLQSGLALHRAGKLIEAQSIYESILKINPEHAEALHLLGVVAAQSNQHQRAAALIGKAISINPNNAAFHSNRGNSLRELEQFEAAVVSYDTAIRIKPEFADAYVNRGNALRDLKQLDAAIASYNNAISIKPEFASAYYNRGIAQGDMRQLDAAIASYDQAISIIPDNAEASWNKSLALLLKGDFAKAWPLYEWRWDSRIVKQITNRETPIFSQPLWSDIENLRGKTILLHSEQGLGDTIQFIRYAKLVAENGGRVIAAVPKPLMNLIQDLDGVSEVVDEESRLPLTDFHCPLLTLPKVFNTTLTTIPTYQAYLHSDSKNVAAWAKTLGEKTQPRVGLVWSGGTGHKNDHNRSIALSSLIDYLPDGIEYVSLQKDVRDSDRLTLAKSSKVRTYDDQIADFSDTAALCDLMDLVISVDTSVAHLSGALGRPTWILLPYVPDWRWLLDRDDSPWYPSVKLYRQNADMLWASVFEKVKADLLLLSGM